MWKGRPCQLVLHYENGFSLIEYGTGGNSLMRGGVRTLWRYPFDRLKTSADDGNRLLWLDFGGEEGEIVRALIYVICFENILTFFLHTTVIFT